MADDTLYDHREQTLVKHFILRHYLERFAYKVGSKWDCITYVDCFAGPWHVRSEELKDSSFAIAIEELKKARTALNERGRTLRLRCLFLEKDVAAHARLAKFASGVTDVEVTTMNRELEEAIGNIVEYVNAGGSKSFPFIFIDPTGWTGFAMPTISPLLRLRPVEILINFMTGHIQRFLDSPNTQTKQSFELLFGSADYRSHLDGLSRSERNEEAVRLYAENVGRIGAFPYVSAAIVLRPEDNRTHFHLIHATRHAKGVAVFKEVEKKAMRVMEDARSRARQRKRVLRKSQPELFPAEIMDGSDYYDGLRDRNLGIAREKVFSEIKSQGRVSYDALWHIAAAFALVWESDLKQWIREWVEAKLIAPPRLASDQRVPQRGKGNLIVLRSPSEDSGGSG